MKEINQLLNTQKLHQLIQHAGILRHMDKVLHAILPPALKGQVKCARLEDGVLTLITHSASYATQVRFSSASLLAALNEQIPNRGITTLRCKVKPPLTLRTAPVTKIARHISEVAAESILTAASAMTNERLSKIWQKLGRRNKTNR